MTNSNYKEYEKASDAHAAALESVRRATMRDFYEPYNNAYGENGLNFSQNQIEKGIPLSARDSKYVTQTEVDAQVYHHNKNFNYLRYVYNLLMVYNLEGHRTGTNQFGAVIAELNKDSTKFFRVFAIENKLLDRAVGGTQLKANILK